MSNLAVSLSHEDNFLDEISPKNRPAKFVQRRLSEKPSPVSLKGLYPRGERQPLLFVPESEELQSILDDVEEYISELSRFPFKRAEWQFNEKRVRTARRRIAEEISKGEVVLSTLFRLLAFRWNAIPAVRLHSRWRRTRGVRRSEVIEIEEVSDELFIGSSYRLLFSHVTDNEKRDSHLNQFVSGVFECTPLGEPIRGEQRDGIVSILARRKSRRSLSVKLATILWQKDKSRFSSNQVTTQVKDTLGLALLAPRRAHLPRLLSQLDQQLRFSQRELLACAAEDTANLHLEDIRVLQLKPWPERSLWRTRGINVLCHFGGQLVEIQIMGMADGAAKLSTLLNPVSDALYKERSRDHQATWRGFAPLPTLLHFLLFQDGPERCFRHDNVSIELI